MAVRNLKRTSAALIASITWAGGSWAPAQFDNRLLPSSESTVIVALRPQAPANQAPTIQAPEIPSNGGVKDGTGKDDEVKTAIGGGTPPTSETGRLNPIVMESVRAPIGAADISVADIGTKIVPEDQAAKQAVATLPLPGGLDRAFEGLTYRWQAANICHLPLYFEEPTLERHGQQRCPTCVQPVVSGGKFLGNLLLYPYKATLHPALENRYALGHFRPGSCAPALHDTLPWSPQAAVVQGVAATGVFVGLPW